MAKITHTALNRKFERVEGTLNVAKREKVIGVFEKKEGTCVLCKQPILKGNGQIMAWHKKCRKEGRRKMREYFKREKKYG